ncbi:MAG: hypothetical protein P4L49_11815 [Desulfosporosinus sp.]|nr:hypothetical protein [Desulfosporosinus sp.]
MSLIANLMSIILKLPPATTSKLEYQLDLQSWNWRADRNGNQDADCQPGGISRQVASLEHLISCRPNV